MLIQNPFEALPSGSGETWYPSKPRVVTNSVTAGWEQGRRVTQPFPAACTENSIANSINMIKRRTK